MGRIIDSCNGLVCYLSSQREIVICNPYIKDYRKLPSPSDPDDTNPRYEYDNYTYCKYGFGYDSKTDDYKFACMSKYPEMSTEIIVYSLKNSWKIWQDIPYELADDDLVLFEGIFYWVEDRSEYAETDEDIGKVICSLESDMDSFKRYTLPQHFKKCIGRIYVCVLGGCLHIIGNHHTGSCSEVWMMKDFGWTKKFTIDETSSGLRCFACLNPKHSFENGEILVQVNSAFSYLYDLKRKRFEKLVFNGFEVFNSCAFLGTFVSPNNLGTSLGNAVRHSKRQKVNFFSKSLFCNLFIIVWILSNMFKVVSIWF
ncbi:hypothetical protein MKW92_026608 [Papaver armeniacum]|nr:hypothetical protein MKW92_026608 [Papaver armeniacum]